MKRPSAAEVERAVLTWERAMSAWASKQSSRSCVALIVADRSLKSLARRLRKPEGKR